jgi:hypothetical protein
VVAGRSFTVTASKEGYQAVTRVLTLNGDTRLDIEVVRRATYTLSGVVSEETPTGRVPLEGVHVEESNFHAGSITYGNGLYSISGLHAGVSPLWVSKEGYQNQIRNVAIDGDTRLDIQLVRR